MTKAPRVLVVGDVMTDYVALMEGPVAIGSDRRARIYARPGGSAATQAVWMARFGLDVDFVGRVGAPDIAVETERLRAAGVTPHLAADFERETGRLIALVDPSGERSFLTDKGANAGLTEADIPDELIAAADHLHLSGYAFFEPGPRAAVQAAMRKASGKSIAIDPASAEFLREAGAAVFLKWTGGAQMLFPNAEEAAVLSGSDDPQQQGERLAAHFELVVIKRGAEGCEAYSGERRWRAPAPRVAVVDTTGAGDAFAAGFLAARLSGAAMEECLARAVASGSEATQFPGGRPPA